MYDMEQLLQSGHTQTISASPTSSQSSTSSSTLSRLYQLQQFQFCESQSKMHNFNEGNPWLRSLRFVLMLTVLFLFNEYWNRTIRELLGSMPLSYPFWGPSEPACGEVSAVISGPILKWYLKRFLSAQIGYFAEFWSVLFQPNCVRPYPSGLNPLQLQKRGHLGVTFRNDDVLTQIILHWQSTLPPGIKPLYPDESPRIFVFATNSNPYNDVLKDGYLHETGGYLWPKSIWTVALTRSSTDIGQMLVNNGGKWPKYLAFLYLKDPLKRGDIFRTNQLTSNGAFSERLERAERVIGYQLPDDKFPSAYIFTAEAQKEQNHPFEIMCAYELKQKSRIERTGLSKLQSLASEIGAKFKVIRNHKMVVSPKILYFLPSTADPAFTVIQPPPDGGFIFWNWAYTDIEWHDDDSVSMASVRKWLQDPHALGALWPDSLHT